VTHFWTFYTDDRYKAVADRLGASLDRFGLTLTACKAPDLGSWLANCNQKPQLLWKFRQEVAGPICCLDADCIVHKPPTYLTDDGALQYDAILWNKGVSSVFYVSSGVSWWNDTPVGGEMLKIWNDLAARRKMGLVDPLLKRVCAEFGDMAKIGRLPPEYHAVYWMDKVADDQIVISCNERQTEHGDGLYARNRVRMRELQVP
jgi:hypothetical protein